MKTQNHHGLVYYLMRSGSLCIFCSKKQPGSPSEVAYSAQKEAQECTVIQEYGL